MDRSRNLGVLTDEEQRQIAATRLLIAGCGLGSAIALLALQTGFLEQTVCDGDVVADHNRNRQPFDARQVGTNKARALAERLRAVDLDARVRVVDAYLTPADVEELVAGADIVVDALDLGALPVIVALHRAARAKGRPVIAPLNVGFGTMTFVFLHGAIPAEEFYGLDAAIGIEEIAALPLVTAVLPRWARVVRQHLPPYGVEQFEAFLRRVATDGWCPVPQIGIAAALSAAVVVTAAVDLALGRPVLLAPQPIQLDARTAVRPATTANPNA